MSTIRKFNVKMMGWVDNLERDLSASNNQPGSSGINTNSTNAIEMVTMTQIEEIKPNSGIITSDPVEEIKQEVSNENIEKNDNQDKEEKKNEDPPSQIFAERVTIAGLEEAFKAKSKLDRYMYRIALFLALLMIIYEGYMIGCQYRDLNTIFNDMIIDKTAPFPNISICFPFSYNDTTVLQKLREVVSDKDIKYMHRHNISLEKDGLDFYKSLFTLTVNISSMSSPIYLLMTNLFEKGQQKAIKERKNLYRLLIPSCSNYLSDCVYNQISFDCCSKAKYLSTLQQSCYQIDLSNVINMEKNQTSSADPLRLNETGFSVDVNNNWNFGAWDEDGSASDGFYIFVDKIPNPKGDPTVIPSNMNAIIILNQPIAVKEKSQCRPNEEKSNLKVFDYYDSYGFHCQGEADLSLVSDRLGCQLPILSHILPDACTLRQLTMFTLVATQAVNGIKDSQDETQFAKNLSNKADDLYRSGTSGIMQSNPCLALCSRWSYKILSASYGSIKYQDQLEDEFKSLNQSWSRIRFVMPWTSIMEHKEEFVAKGYLAFCDIGGMMGVYAGFSIITFVQLAFYGGYWFSKRKKKLNKVFPAGQQESKV